MGSDITTYKTYVREMMSTVDRLWTRRKEGASFQEDEVDYQVTHKVINLAIRDLEYSTSCCKILDYFINFKFKDKTYAEKLEYLEDLFEVREFADLQINTFPFGDLTEEVFPYFVGICQGDTTFSAVMDAADIHCKRMVKLRNRDDKTVLILTDKWDAPKFRKKYATSFITYAYKYKIVFIFLLVTDLGIRRIPFSISNRVELNYSKGWQQIEPDKNQKHDKNALSKLQRFDDCVYEFHESALIKERGSFRCTIDFKKMQYTCVSLVIPNLKNQGNIPKSALNRFAQRVIAISEMPGSGYSEDYSKALDYTLTTVDIFGKHFEWIDAEDNPICEKLATAIGKLLTTSGFNGL